MYTPEYHRFFKKDIERDKKSGQFVAEDFTLLKDDKADLEKLFAPLKDIKYPVYATLWNHDTMHPWPDISDNLIKTLKKYNVIFLQNTSIKLKNKDINILWLWDNWDNADDVSLIKNFIPL